MEWWQAVILGVVEGLTEYLPVSSTGHLILAQRAMGMHGEAANAFAVCIQAGAIVAVLGLYARRVGQVARGCAGKVGLGAGDPAGFRLGLAIAAAFVPAAVIGKLFDEPIERLLFGLWPVVAAWLVGGLAILAVARWRRGRAEGGDKGVDLEHLTLRMALIIGVAQCVAMWPGTSRSLVTIVAGVLVGLNLAAAVEFSFLLGVLTLLAATLYKALLDSVTVEVDGAAREVMMLQWMAHEFGWGALIIGTVAAWLSAVAAVRWMVSYLRRHGLAVFGWYRVGLAAVVGALLLAGWLES